MESKVVPTSGSKNMKGKAFNQKQQGNPQEKLYNAKEDNNTKGKDLNTKYPTQKKQPTASKGNTEEVLRHEQTIHVK